jgi:hypothetical protein
MGIFTNEPQKDKPGSEVGIYTSEFPRITNFHT